MTSISITTTSAIIGGLIINKGSKKTFITNTRQQKKNY